MLRVTLSYSWHSLDLANGRSCRAPFVREVIAYVFFYADFIFVTKLAPVTVQEFNPVVLSRIVGRADHRASISRCVTHGKADPGSWHYPHRQNLSPTSGFGSYGDIDQRGVRVITLDESDLGDYGTELISYQEFYGPGKLPSARLSMFQSLSTFATLLDVISFRPLFWLMGLFSRA